MNGEGAKCFPNIPFSFPNPLFPNVLAILGEPLADMLLAFLASYSRRRVLPTVVQSLLKPGLSAP